MSTYDAPMLRALFLARLREHLGALTPPIVADIMTAAAAEAGLIPSGPHTTVVGDHAPMVLLVVAETLRANAGATNSYQVLANVVLDALATYGFVFAPPQLPTVHLTDGQRRALEMAADGLSYGEIATVMGRAEATVRNHLEKARAALGARNTIHAVAIAVRLGLLAAEVRIPAQRLHRAA